MRPRLRIPLDIMVRFAAFVAGGWVFTTVYERLVPVTPGDADIGEGLLAFLLMILVALLWAGADGYRRGFGTAATIWVVTGVLTGVSMAIILGLRDPGSSLEQVLTGLADSAPFLIGLVVAPALVAAAVIAGLRSASQPSTSPR